MPSGEQALAELGKSAVEAGLSAGLDLVRIAGAGPFPTTRRHLFERKALGLHGGMSFTYRRPERSTDPSVALPGAASLVVGALFYDATDPGGTPLTGRVGRSARWDEYAVLREGLSAVGRRLKAAGYNARVLADDNTLVDRAAAFRAGIGWWGKNTMILVPGRGSWFVLGSVLTDAALPADGGPVADHCGPCFRCAEACPTGAIVAPGVLDARRCLSWLLEAPGPIPRSLRPAVANRIYGCDACQEVCPPNRAADSRRARLAGHLRPGASPGRPPAPPPPTLAWMVGAADEELLECFGHFYLAGRQVGLLRRNALVALGNVARADQPGVAEAVDLGLRSADELVRAHAVWAAGRLGLAALASQACSGDASAMVRDELAALPGPREGAA